MRYTANFLDNVTEGADKDKSYRGTGGVYSYLDGNLISDSGNGVTSVTYNFLDLPTQIKSADGTIDIIYDASGAKLKQTNNPANADPIETYHYHGGIEYKDGKRESIAFGEGRVVYNGELESTDGVLPVYTEWMIADHLGNTRARFVDKNKDGKITATEDATPEEYELIGSYHYYPFGMAMEGTFSEHQGVKNKYQYNGIEHMDFIGHGISLTTFRVHDAAVGRWWQVDPKAESAMGQSPYNSMWNNPISYSDPDGDFALAGIGAASFFAVSTISGMINGNLGKNGNNPFGAMATGAKIGNAASAGLVGLIASVLPSYQVQAGNFSFGISPALAFGNGGLGVGANVSASYSSNGISIGASAGGSYFVESVGTGLPGWEGRFGGGASYTNSQGFGAGLTTMNFRSGETSQHLGGVTLSGWGKSLHYENDQPWGIPISDGEDRWRTTGVRVSGDGWAVGLKLFTGDPGTSGSRTYDLVDGKKIYNSGTADKYRFGALYGELGGYRVGLNSEGIRHLAQNKFAHDLMSKGQSKPQGPWHFRQIPSKFPGGFYGGKYSTNPYTTW